MAVYTNVSDDALEAFLAEYHIGSLVAVRGIAEGVENSNFSLRTTLATGCGFPAFPVRRTVNDPSKTVDRRFGGTIL